MNVFGKVTQEEFETFTDDPDGARVMLDCEKCGRMVTEAKWHRKTKLLSWKCNECSHISKQENFSVE